MPPALERIDHVHIHVADRAAAERWYADVLGFKRVAALEYWAAGGGPLRLANPADTIHLALFERPPESCCSTIAMAASGEEFLAWRRFLADALGRTIEAIDHRLSSSMYFNDPDGNPFEITCDDYAEIAEGLRKPDE